MRRSALTGGYTPCRRPAGSALLLCLVLLSALTLLGLAAASDRQLQVRVAANIEGSGAARAAADAALDWAADWLFSLPGDAPPELCAANCAAGDGVMAHTALPDGAEYQPAQWWTEHGHAPGLDPVDGTVLNSDLAGRPARWIIVGIEVAAEETAPGTAFYRILAHGRDEEGLHTAVTEAIVARPWGDPGWSDPLPLTATSESFCRREAFSPCGRLAWRRLR